MITVILILQPLASLFIRQTVGIAKLLDGFVKHLVQVCLRYTADVSKACVKSNVLQVIQVAEDAHMIANLILFCKDTTLFSHARKKWSFSFPA